MWNTLNRIIAPVLLNVDFRDRYWDVTPCRARCLLVLAVVADLFVQWLVGSPDIYTVLASVLTPAIFWAVPVRLAGAVGWLYIAQALLSLVVVTAAAMVSRNAAEVAGIVWSAWCMFALVRLILSYLRTPKALM